jgi:hypothetical protein
MIFLAGRRPARAAVLAASFVIVAAACGGSSSTDGSGTGDDPVGAGASAASGGAGTSGSAGTGQTAGSAGTSLGGTTGTPPAGAAANTFIGTDCIGGDTQCSNCIDDDGDGLIDAMDPECTGPLDDDEATFATGIPGDNQDFCQDCFFDGNSGHGDDGCQYHTECLYGRTPSGGGSSCFDCETSQQCHDFCLPYTPNGCDCFGCCELHTSSGVRTVLLTASCTQEFADDPEKCISCVQDTVCVNDCGECELCLGKTTLPPECGSQPPTGGSGGTGGSPDPGCIAPYCERGQPCGLECLEACPAGEYCLTGCCVPVVR